MGDGLYRGNVLVGQSGALTGSADTAASFSAAKGHRVDVPFVQAFNPPFAFSVEFWAKPTGGSGFRSPVTSREVTPADRYGYVFYITDLDQWQFRTGQGPGAAAYNTVTGPTAQLGVWTHVVGTFDGAATTLYVNGVRVGSAAGLFSPNLSAPLRIGAGATESQAGAFYFEGGIDEVAVYGQALSAAQVAHHYHLAKNPGPSLSYDALVRNDGALGYWRLNEAPVAAPARAVNHGDLGTAADGVYLEGARGGRPGAVVGDANSAAAFDGVDDKVEVPFHEALNRTNMTIECWARVSPGSAGQRVLVAARDVTAAGLASGYFLYASPDHTWQFWTGSGAWHLLVGPAAIENVWAHLVGTVAGNTKQFYVDGVLVGTDRTLFTSNPLRPLRLGGGATESPFGNDFFQGDVDEVAVYEGALSPERVLAHFQAGVGRKPAPYAPSLAFEPEDQTVYVSQPVTFRVGAVGSLPLRYQWRLNGVRLPDATNAHYRIERAQPGHAGAYTVEVINASGAATSGQAVLTVRGASIPVVVEPPQSITRLAGGEARFSVRAVGSAQFSYQWQFDGGNLPGHTNATLTLSDLQAGNAGAYRVWVGNEVGATLSESARLTVQVPAPDSYVEVVMADRPAGYWRLGESSEVTARDSAGGHDGFYHNGVTLRQPGALPADPDTAAGFLSEMRSKVDVPHAPALNPAAFTLELWARPTGIEPVYRSALTAREGDPPRGYALYLGPGGEWQWWTGTGAEWDVLVGPALASGRWTHFVGTYDGRLKRLFVNGLEAGWSSAPFAPNTLHPLRIGAGASEDFFGSFFFTGDLDEVAVYRQALSAERVLTHYNAALPARTPPQIARAPASRLALPGTTVSFAVHATGSLPLTYQWQFNEANLIGKTRPTVTLERITAAQAGRYRALVQNGAGTNLTAAATLEVISVPDLAYRDVVLADHPVGYWRLGEPTGTTAADTIGRHHGTLRNGVRLGLPGAIERDPDTAARFVPADQTRIEIPYARALNSSQGTFELWVQPSLPAPGRRVMLAARTEQPARGLSFEAGADGTWQFWSGRGGSAGWDILRGPLLEGGRWTHLAATWDGSTKRFFVDGLEVASSKLEHMPNESRPLRLGAGATDDPTGNFFFAGDLDEVACYEQPLSPERILVRYAIGARSTWAPTLTMSRSPAGLVLSWTHGTLQGAPRLGAPWADVPLASPLTLAPSGASRFFRVRQ